MTLDELFIKHGTDKSSKHHNYAQAYENHFGKLRDQSVTLLELGYGAYHKKDDGGQGARAWLDYFPNGKIISLDKEPKNALKHSRFKFFQCSQDSEKIDDIIEQNGIPNIIIDDASHICDLTINSFYLLFPLLAKGGWYVIEDIEGSFFEGWSKGTKDAEDFKFRSPVNLGRKLINDLNYKHIPNFSPGYPVQSIHFYPNIIFIQK